MASIPLPVDHVMERLSGDLHVAALNGPDTTVIAGDLTQLTDLVAAFQAEGIQARQVNVDYASHTPHIDPLIPQLRELLAPITPHNCEIAFYSTVTTHRITDTTTLD